MEMSLNPILERRNQNQQNIAKSFVEDLNKIDINSREAFAGRSADVVEEFRKSFGGKFDFDLLEKGGGPGSRGGKVIGYTKSGKPIYDNPNNPAHKDFTSKDHREASNLHNDNYNKLSKQYQKWEPKGGWYYEDNDGGRQAQKEYKNREVHSSLSWKKEKEEKKALKNAPELSAEAKTKLAKHIHHLTMAAHHAEESDSHYTSRPGKTQKDFVRHAKLSVKHSKEMMKYAPEGLQENEYVNKEIKKNGINADDEVHVSNYRKLAKYVKEHGDETFSKSFDDDFNEQEDDLNKSLNTELIDEQIKKLKLIDDLVNNLQKSNIDDLQKGEIMDKLVYGYGAGNNDTFKFTKTGKQIKEMLPGCIEALAEQKGEIIATMQACIENAGIEPTEDYSPGQYKVIKIKRYPYELIKQEWNEVNRTYSQPTDAQKACCQYNDLCWSLKSILEDILACKIILANVEDDKKYNLTISQLVALTLGDDLIND